MDSKKILNLLEKHAKFMKESFGVVRIGLFGSFVRGKAKKTSDIDVLVEFSKNSFDNYMDLKFFLEDKFKRPVDLVMIGSIKPALREYILQEVKYAA